MDVTGASLFLGRRAELGALVSALGNAATPRVVVGEAGVGKTTLIHQAVYAGEDRRRVFEGGALATLCWSPWLPLRRALGHTAASQLWDGDAEYVAAGVEALVGDGLLIVDDLQWADPGTWRVVEFLAGRLRFVGAVRRGDPATATSLERLAAVGVAQLDIGPLDRSEALSLARHVRTGLGEAEAEAIVARSGGNPLLIEELADGNVASLRLAMAARMRALSPAAVADLELLALAGHGLPGAALQEAAALVDSGLVRARDGELAIRHALLAEVVADGLADGRRRELHRQLARHVSDSGDIARHHLLAGDRGAAYAAAMIAVERATTPGERSAHLVTAASSASAELEPDLLLRAARAAVEAGDYTAGGALLDRLPDDGGQLGAQAALTRARARSEVGDDAGWAAAVAAGLGCRCDEATAVRLRAERARLALFVDRDPRGALTLATETARDADRLHRYRGYTHYVLGTVQQASADAGWMRSLPQAMAFSRDEGDLECELLAANNLIVAHESGGDPGVGRRVAAELMARCEQLKLLRWRSHFWATELNLAMHAGDFRQVAQAAPRLLAEPVMRRTRDEVGSTLAFSLVNLGRIEEGLAAAEQALADSDLHRSNLFHLRAVASSLAGDPAAALAQWEPFLACAESPTLVALAAPVFSRAACGVGRTLHLPDLTEACEQPILHAVPHELAGIALLPGDPDGAAAAFGRAADLWAPYHRQGEVRCRWSRGVALLAAGRNAEAITTLAAADEQARRHGMEPMRALIAQAQRRLGVRRVAPRSGGALSRRETEVLDLVGAGLTDAVVAARLGLSVRTVQTHVAAARRKLGAANRNQAVLLAREAAGR